MIPFQLSILNWTNFPFITNVFQNQMPFSSSIYSITMNTQSDSLMSACLKCQCMYVLWITCPLAAWQGVALLADSTEWPLVLYIHTAAAPVPHAAGMASPTHGNTEKEGCVAEDSPLLLHLLNEQRKNTETGSYFYIYIQVKAEVCKMMILGKKLLGLRWLHIYQFSMLYQHMKPNIHH